MLRHSIELETGEGVEVNIEQHYSEITVGDRDEIDDDVIGRHASLFVDSHTILYED